MTGEDRQSDEISQLEVERLAHELKGEVARLKQTAAALARIVAEYGDSDSRGHSHKIPVAIAACVSASIEVHVRALHKTSERLAAAVKAEEEMRKGAPPRSEDVAR